MKKIRLLVSVMLFLAVITVGVAPMLWPSPVRAEGPFCNCTDPLDRNGVRENPWDPCNINSNCQVVG
jgi:hypothetical protein